MEKFNNADITNSDYKGFDISCNHIFVLAGGQTSNGYVNNWVKTRLDSAIDIYKKNKCYIYCIGGGTYHKIPILNKYNHVIHESTSCSKYLISNSVSEKFIRKEWASYDTIANGFYSFLNFIIPLKLKKITVITSKFHMDRVKVIFNFMKKICNNDVDFIFIETEDNMDSELLALRKEREKKSIKNFELQMKNINNLTDFFNWFYIKHNAYNSSSYKKDIENNLLTKSY